MTAPDIFALGGRDDNQDAEILALFHSWLDVCRERDALRVDDEGAIDDAVNRMTKIEDAIFASRGGPIGLAIKTFFSVRLDCGQWAPAAAQIRLEEDGRDDPCGWIASMLRDAAALVPKIGECVAAVIHDDAPLIAADMAMQWVESVWPGDPRSSDEWRNGVLAKRREALDCIASTEAKTPRGEAIKAKHASAAGTA